MAYYRLLCEETGETQTFATRKEAQVWAAQCTRTFGRPMSYVLTQIIERSMLLHPPLRKRKQQKFYEDGEFVHSILNP